MKSSVSKRPYVMAVVIGTALSVYAAPGQAAATPTPQATAQAIADMSRYCVTCWRNAASVSRLLDRLHARGLPSFARTAADRRLGSGAARRWGGTTRIPPRHRHRQEAHPAARKFSPAIESVADQHDQYRRDLREEREVVRQAAAEVLTPRQQRILQLSFEGWSVQDMSEELQLPVERVSDEKYKAIRKLRAHLLA